MRRAGEIELHEAEIIEVTRRPAFALLRVAEVDPTGRAGTLQVFVGADVLKRTSRSSRDLSPGAICSVRGTVAVFGEEMRLRIDASQLRVLRETRGPLSAARRSLERRLEREGALQPVGTRTMNLDDAMRKVLVLEPEAGAGAADFRRAVQEVDTFEFEFETIVTEGPGAVASIVSALQRAGRADIVIIVRGGGGRLALRTFDLEPVVRAVLTAPVPVALGVGHARDNELLAARVAAANFDTPTAVGAFIRAAHYRRKGKDKQARRRLQQAAERRATAANSRRVAELDARYRSALEREERANRAHARTKTQLGAFAHGRVLSRAARMASLTWGVTGVTVALLALGNTGAGIVVTCALAGTATGVFIWTGRARACTPLGVRDRRYRQLSEQEWVDLALRASTPRMLRRLYPPLTRGTKGWRR